ncbi:hypothetical protein [Breoghania sp.]|uniref:hypothetical protein n=1 Tax=Breoghania sp. TaxID=2065378 RepID=UPI002AA7FC06|nr:hypothetical protein [Breoghania sp.]
MRAPLRRLTPPMLALAGLAMTLAVGHSAWALWGDVSDNRVIRALHDGHDAPLRGGANPRAIHARALFLAWRDRIAEAEALAADLTSGHPRLRCDTYLAIGNARMRAAFELIETGRLDDAIPEVALAKIAYRAALKDVPANYDAKVNLDLAMRLVRDMPRAGEETDEEEQTRPRRLWTDLPGLPRGEP